MALFGPREPLSRASSAGSLRGPRAVGGRSPGCGIALGQQPLVRPLRASLDSGRTRQYQPVRQHSHGQAPNCGRKAPPSLSLSEENSSGAGGGAASQSGGSCCSRCRCQECKPADDNCVAKRSTGCAGGEPLILAWAALHLWVQGAAAQRLETAKASAAQWKERADTSLAEAWRSRDLRKQAAAAVATRWLKVQAATSVRCCFAAWHWKARTGESQAQVDAPHVFK
ncbi:unnamed protein product, partial [Polarella glacialis]